MEFILITLGGFTGLIYVVPIFSRRARTYFRQNKAQRRLFLSGLFTLVLLLPSLFYLDLVISLGETYGCVDRNGYPTEDNLQLSYCDEDIVLAQYNREFLFQNLLPPFLRVDEICWTVEAGRFCNSMSDWGWQEYLTRSGMSAFAAILCTIFLWAFIGDERKKKRGGESTL